MAITAVHSGYRSGIHSYSDSEGYVVSSDHEVVGYDIGTSFVPPTIPHLPEKQITSIGSRTTRYVLDDDLRRVTSMEIAAETLQRAEHLVNTATTVTQAVDRLQKTQVILKKEAEMAPQKTHHSAHPITASPKFENYTIVGTTFVPPAIPLVRALNVSSGTPHYLIDETDRRIISLQTAAESLSRLEHMIETAASVAQADDLLNEAISVLNAEAIKI
jgi:hypothetical protein